MNTFTILALKALRKLYAKAFGGYQLPSLQREEDADKASELIYNLLVQDKPCMIARFGAFELATIVNYLGIKNPYHSILKFIKGEQPEWWWNEKLIQYMNTNAGFFPPTHEAITRFCELMIADAQQMDILCSWQKTELYLNKYFSQQIIKVNREKSNPFFAHNPWTRALKGKKILVVHPFAQSICKQYSNREALFENHDLLPDFASLKVIKAVQSIGGSNDGFKDWFDALNYMKGEINKCDFDICLIGCGAYGFPLAAHVKRLGKKAVHIGGTLQLYFGIKGKRWESQGYIGTDHDYSLLFNEHWIRPSETETPQNNSNIENGCYW